MANIIDEIQINNIKYKVTLNSGMISNGLKVDSNGIVSINATTGITADNGGLHLDEKYIKDLVGINLKGNGLSYESNKLSVNIGTGLKFNSTNNSIELDVNIDDKGYLYINPTSITTPPPSSGPL